MDRCSLDSRDADGNLELDDIVADAVVVGGGGRHDIGVLDTAGAAGDHPGVAACHSR